MQVRSAAERRFASAADAESCTALLRGGSRTFFAASLVLPQRIATPAVGLYAFCRLADDAIDQGADPAAALAALRRRLDDVYAGMPHDIAADRAFADAVLGHGIPKAFPEALLEGFEWDARNRRYKNLSELHAYAVRVAGTVGTMMAMVMGAGTRSLLSRACDLGVAMQLTNIARDVGEDARRGRLYLPLDWMRAAGLDPEEWLANPVFDRRIGKIIERVLRWAEVLYRRADSGLARLPAACRPGMYAARLLYAEIGREVARHGLDSVNRRAVVSWPRKTRLLLQALAAAAQRRPPCNDAPLRECVYLLDAVIETGDSPPPRAAWRRVQDRVVWLTQLFERLERRDHTV